MLHLGDIERLRKPKGKKVIGVAFLVFNVQAFNKEILSIFFYCVSIIKVPCSKPTHKLITEMQGWIKWLWITTDTDMDAHNKCTINWNINENDK